MTVLGLSLGKTKILHIRYSTFLEEYDVKDLIKWVGKDRGFALLQCNTPCQPKLYSLV